MSKEQDLNILLNGTRILVEREKVAQKTKSGIIVPDSFIKAKESVSEVHTLDPYQKRGRIVGMGVGVSSKFREHFAIGDMIHFGPHACNPVPIRKDVIDDNSPYALLDEFQVDWKEL